ncbi:MAG: hypothetical protein EP338_04230 [Bacteroidetes bacterium]|nr:MAG: hypothetical protein EP338_04230 [Bacteroidota bacterium]
MRLFYFVLKVTLQYAIRVYYPRLKKVNAPKQFYGRTIYVSNHAASFMDPLVIAVLQRPIVFFMTRSDVFNKKTNGILSSAHMLPIYREQDGEDTRQKNEEVFEKCSTILEGGRNLLIFGEGFTDDVFIRRLKPIKKGAARIAFGALEACNWEKDIYMAAIGVNYANPGVMGSEVLVSNSERFCLNDYREQYEENPVKTIIDVTRRIEQDLQDQLTHVKNKDWAPFHEAVCRLRRNGLNAMDTDYRIKFKQRWKNSQALATWINQQDLKGNQELIQLKEDLESYFELLKQKGLEEHFVSELDRTGKLEKKELLLKLVILSPFVPFGLIQFYPLYRLIKNFVEKKFKRKVFWSSVKMVTGMILMGFWGLILYGALDIFLIHSFLISFMAFLASPLIGLIAYEWFKVLRLYQRKKSMDESSIQEALPIRRALMARMDEIIPR